MHMDNNKEDGEKFEWNIHACFTVVKKVFWKQFYGNLPKATPKIAMKCLWLAGHCVHHPEEIALKVILWQPTEGRANRGRKLTVNINNIKRYWSTKHQ